MNIENHDPIESGVETRFGFLALLGAPNSGKSTLLNACIGQKIAGVSSKPQTTRNRILGLIQGDCTQIGVLDTPGLQRSESSGSAASATRLTRYMNREAWGAASDADVICYLVDSTLGVSEIDKAYLKDLILKYRSKVHVILSKVDKLRKEERAEVAAEVKNMLLEMVAQSEAAESEVTQTEAPSLVELAEGTEVTPVTKPAAVIKGRIPPVLLVSAKTKEDVDGFIERISNLMPVGPHHYGRTETTDRSPSFVCAELIREQVFRRLGQEIPYGTAVSVTEITRRANGVRYVGATITVPKDAHKGMLIGSQGSKLKEIGAAARPALEGFFGDKVFLELFVKVQPGWTRSVALIEELQGAPSVLG